ncbi:hypothetical protein K523DRAFT_147168 [Schizophyllum commune Tattone D]|nr:hypothetical protein K523DRAFT_147168 [Schizophyllum commune Tattone D]
MKSSSVATQWVFSAQRPNDFPRAAAQWVSLARRRDGLLQRGAAMTQARRRNDLGAAIQCGRRTNEVGRPMFPSPKIFNNRLLNEELQ